MPQLQLKTAIALIGLASFMALVIAWITQYGFGFEPCQLCLKQRWPYYLAIPLALIAYLSSHLDKPLAARWLIGFIGILMLIGAGIAFYHAGVEWKYWPGPSTCAKGYGFAGNIGDLMNQLKTARIVPCDQAPFRILGISPAGANVVFSLGLAGFAFMHAVKNYGR